MTGYLLRCYITNNDEGSCQQEVNSLAEGCTHRDQSSALQNQGADCLFQKEGGKNIYPNPHQGSSSMILTLKVYLTKFYLI